MENWKTQLSKVKPTLPNKKAERRRLIGKEITLQKKLVSVRVGPNVIRRRWQEIN